MKRLIVPGLILLAIAALLTSGNRILEKALDAQLPQLLSRELGIPVTIGPTRTRITTLTVHSPRLVMGDPADPAIVATEVSVSISLSRLLRGEIKLRRAGGATLMVKPSQWPGSDSPWPTDYLFLDPYLPNHIALEEARYVDKDDASHTFGEPRWRRSFPGASLNWKDNSLGPAVDVSIELGSLDELLRLARLELQIETSPVGQDDATVDVNLEVKPGKESGYGLTGRLEAAGMAADVVAGHNKPWALPDQSGTSIKLIEVGKLQALIDSYTGKGKNADTRARLASKLPRLSLPAHKGQVTIGEIRWRGEAATDTALEFVSGPDGVTVPSLSSRGPTGILQARVNVASDTSGWQLGMKAELEAAAQEESLAAPHLDAEWFWREGSAELSGEGQTWDALLNSMQGKLALNGSHRGEAETPVVITAMLGRKPGIFALETIEVTVAEARISGSVALSGDQQKKLTGRLRAEQLDLDIFMQDSAAAEQPGIEVPTYLDALEGVDMDWQADVSDVTVGGIKLTKADILFTRTAKDGTAGIRALGPNGGQLDAKLLARIYPDKPSDVTLTTDLANFNLPEFFQQDQGVIDTRISGSISFASRGEDIEEIFSAMRGRADLAMDFRADHDWQRAPKPEEQVQVSGNATLVVESTRITGLQIHDLAIDSVVQNLTGNLSFVDGRKPWLEANLTSDKLDLAGLAKLRPEAAAGQSTSVSLSPLRKLQESRLTLQAKSLRVAEMPLNSVDLKIATTPSRIDIEQLDFSLHEGRLTSKGGVSWVEDKASLSLDAGVTDISLENFITDAPSPASAPLSGAISLRSTGATVTDLLAGLTGDIRLETSPGGDTGTPGAGAKIEMTARQTSDGVHAEIRRFHWRGTDLSGQVRYRDTSPPLLEVEIGGGSLSLLPWQETEQESTPTAEEEPDTTIIGNTARAGASVVGGIIAAPLRLMSGPREAEPGDQLFNHGQLPLQWLGRHNAKFEGKLDTVTGRNLEASNVQFSASLLSGRLDINLGARALNEGKASLEMSIDTARSPAAAEVRGTFNQLRGDLINPSVPRSGYFELTSSGNSQAELAGNITGIAYLELGAGPLDYGNLMLLTSDVASSVFQALIPGIEREPPQLECAVVLGEFKDGIGSAPFGYAARTRRANLVGQIELDLKKELVHLNFSSSSRKGVGLSVGNVFSNTVEVEGPLTDPRIVPNTSGLAWRSWAAVVTGGLSLVGESMLKRALSSENPCKSVRKHIREDFCQTGNPASASPLICPPS